LVILHEVRYDSKGYELRVCQLFIQGRSAGGRRLYRPGKARWLIFLGGVQWLDAMTPPLEVHLKRLVQIVKALLLAEPAMSENDGVQSQSGASVEDRRSIANLNDEVQILSTKSYHRPRFRAISVVTLTVVAAILIWTLHHLAGINRSGVDLSRGRASADEAMVLSKANLQDTERQADAAFRDKNFDTWRKSHGFRTGAFAIRRAEWQSAPLRLRP
jgi:hypothetical protein